jgi:hypothetical protein
VAEYVQRRAAGLEWLTEPWPARTRFPTPPPDPPHRDLLAARIGLLAPQAVQDAWTQLVDAAERLDWNVNENGDRDEEGELTAAVDDPDVVATRKAIERLTVALRQAIEADRH